MKKNFYRVTNVLLSSLIALLGFGSCKTTKNASKDVKPETEIDGATGATYNNKGGDTLKVTPQPYQRPDQRVRVLYGVRQPERIAVDPSEEPETTK